MAKAKAKRFEVYGYLTEANEWQLAGEFPDMAGADGFVRESLIGTKGVKTARILDTGGEYKDREYNCIPVAKPAKDAA